MKKKIPNILTTFRIICSVSLVFFKSFSVTFMVLYILAGVSDILDGFLARRFGAQTEFGSKYDTLADVIMVLICIIKILPVLELKMWCFIWIGAIALLKIINIVVGYIIYRKMVAVHSIANKVTGALLFLSPIALIWINTEYVVAVLCVIAAFSALQEGYYIIVRK